MTDSRLHIVSTKDAPAAIGPYSQAIVANGFVFCSGQIPLHPQTGEIVGKDIKTQATQAITNLFAILEASGSHYTKVVKVTCFLKDMEHFKQMNEVYSEMFKGHAPARAAVEVARLPRDVLFEIEAVALI